jgi:hypothetical protein
MISTSTFRYSRTDAGYLVHRGTEYLGSVARDGRAWIISDTARGALPGQPHRYATRIDAVDALSAMLRGAAALDALPTDEPADEVAPAAQPLAADGMPPIGDPRWALATRRRVAITAVHHMSPADAALELGVELGEQSQCTMCRYYSGHTSWCPNRTAQPAEQPADDSDSMQPGETVNAWAARIYGEHEVADRTTPPAELDDRQLWLQFMIEDRALSGYDDDPNEPDDERHGALIAAIGERFGPDATENTADYAVSLHMSGDDLVTWARDQHEHLVAIATGRLTPAWRRDDDVHVLVEHVGCGRCDRLVERAAAAALSHPSQAGVVSDGEHRATAVRDMAALRAARTLGVA